MSLMMCDFCERDVDTDHREVFEVRDGPNGRVWTFCEPCLMEMAEKLSPPFLINGDPAAEWVKRAIGE